jgi:hypothetical protein
MKWEDITDAEKIAIKIVSEASFETFIRIFFQFLQGQKFKRNWHHTYECKLAENVYYGDIKRVIINVAPGSTKTEIWSIHWICWCILKCISDANPRSSRWLPLSYSDELVKENAKRVKEILDSEEFSSLWPITVSKTTQSGHNWMYRDTNNNSHRLYGTSINGQVTGRRGGYMANRGGFTGAVILDDPQSPKDIDSGLLMDKGNKKLNRIVRSRLAHDDVPIILVTQRIAKGDSTDFLNSDKTPDTYVQFNIPALIDRTYVESLPENIRESCIADTGFTGKRTSYWPDKEPTETLLSMEKADNYMFSSQYQQTPNDAMEEGVVYKQEITLLVEEKRFCTIPVEKHLPVYTFWDLAIGDRMVIWLMQPYGNELRLISCYGNNNEGMEHYIHWLKDFRDQYGIRYEAHMAPHDIGVRDMLTNESRIKRAERMGIKFNLVERCSSKRESIASLKNLFPRLFIDKYRCDTDLSGNSGAKARYTGWKALNGLRRVWDHTNEVFKDDTGPKWCTDYCDALQQMGLYYKPKSTKSTKSTRRTRSTSGGWMQG